MYKTCYSSAYSARTPTPSMVKLKPVAEAVAAGGLTQLIHPGEMDLEKLRRLHHPDYVDAYLRGENPLASAPGWLWTSEIRDGVLAINAGQLTAARWALREGVAANVAQGFHHAGYRRGENFCTFNGLALLAQEFPDKRVFVLDCDEHGGNGTADFTTRLQNLFNYSICGTFWSFAENDRSILHALTPSGGNFQPYRNALKSAFTLLLKWRADLVVYQAGADPHENDHFGSLELTTAQLAIRDRLVFQFCRAQQIPVLFVLAGGYQTPIDTKLVPLHVNTFKAAAEVFAL
jgi:acetoin utilization deacetylase AcuC-like enzyme